jgi:hypothetical protein
MNDADGEVSVKKIIGVALLASAALACGGGGSSAPDTLTCDWLASNNCWKMTVDEAVACLPPELDMGTLSADHKTCTYASGVTVTFATPLMIPAITGQGPLPDPKLNFTLTNGGVDCLHYEDTAAGFKLVVKGQTVQESSPGYGLSISCPDGTTVSTSNALGILSCGGDGGGFLGGIPGKFWSSGGTNFSFGLIGTTNSSQPVFNCAP